MTALKSARTLAASLGVLAVGCLAASPAMAFGKVHWDWNADVDTHVDIDAYIDLKVDITGMVQVEKLQIFLGDVKAESIVHDIDNNPIVPTGDSHDGKPKPKPNDMYGFNTKTKLPPMPEHCKDKRKCDTNPKVDVKPLDATTQLPIVLSAATAVGNNQSITSDVPVFLHDAQFVADVSDHHKGGDDWYDPCKLMRSISCDSNKNVTSKHDYGSGNAFVDLALDFLSDAKKGDLKHADISAKSLVWDIKNASVDSSATAVANNISVTLASDVNGEGSGGSMSIKCIKYPCQPDHSKDGITSNHIVIADITQFALANVSATSHVSDVSATGYKNMRQLTTDTLQTIDGVENTPVSVPTPWISSVATAVGNNVSISVGNVTTNYKP